MRWPDLPEQASLPKLSVALWFQMATTRQKISSLDVVSRIFGKVSVDNHMYMISVSGDYIRIIFKICQTVAGISITSQFHEFLKCNFWRVFAT